MVGRSSWGCRQRRGEEGGLFAAARAGVGSREPFARGRPAGTPMVARISGFERIFPRGEMTGIFSILLPGRYARRGVDYPWRGYNANGVLKFD
jgi:hypothetical protein